MKKRSFILLLMLLSTLLVVACSSGNELNASYPSDDNMDSGWGEHSDDHIGREVEYDSEPPFSSGDQHEAEAGSPGADGVEQRIIREHFVEQKVQDLAEIIAELQREVQAISGAYIESLEQWQSESRNETKHHARIILRIPVEQWDAFEASIGEQGQTVQERISGRNVTEEFIDNESRLRNLTAHEERILALYERADTIEDMLQIERELTRIRESIETIEGRQTYLRNVTSTVKLVLDLLEVEEHELAAASGDQSIWKESWSTFTKSLASLAHLLQRGFVFLAAALPYLILIGLVGGVIIWLIIKNRRQADGDMSN